MALFVSDLVIYQARLTASKRGLFKIARARDFPVRETIGGLDDRGSDHSDRFIRSN